MRRLALLGVVSTLLTGCTPTYYVLADGNGRVLEVFNDPLSCQFAAVWYQQRETPDTTCHEMDQTRLNMFNLEVNKP